MITLVWQGDRPEFVDAAIHSVLIQSHPNFELIIVKNGPITGPVEDLVQLHIASDVRIRLLELRTNVGPAEARNFAVREARGEYIAILDSDDIAERDRLEKQIAFIVDQGADLVGSCYRVIDDRGKIVAQKRMPLSTVSIRKLAHVLNPIGNSTVMARAEVLRNNPYPKSEVNGVTFGEDYALWVDMLLKGLRLVNDSACLVQFRSGPDFLAKRSGWIMFRTDLRNKVRAVALLRPIYRPSGYLLAIASTLSRLMPRPVLRVLYAIRQRLTFDMR